MADEKKEIELTEEQKKAKELVDDQMTKLGEVFSQCWESEEFKEAFMADPKAIFKEYGVNYEESMNYKIIDTPNKTIVHVLPYKNAKKGIEDLCEIFKHHVEGLEDGEDKQILLEDWSYSIYQNTEDTYYVPIPLCPENLTPEELELVNGGCLIFALVFLFQTTTVATTVMTAAILTIAAVVDAVAAFAAVALVAAGAVLAVAMVAVEISATFDFTGVWLFNGTAAIGEGHSGNSNVAGLTGNSGRGATGGANDFGGTTIGKRNEGGSTILR